MKVVGLLSGGKDSCFNLCHCVAQGHEVVAVASLGPEGGKGAPDPLNPVYTSIHSVPFYTQRKSIHISIRLLVKMDYISLLKLSNCRCFVGLSWVQR